MYNSLRQRGQMPSQILAKQFKRLVLECSVLIALIIISI